MKSYCDLSQCKVLMEFLPHESADMKWCFWKSEIDAPKTPTFGYSKSASEGYKDTEAVYLPCWSLAALLSVIKPVNGNTYTLRGTLDGGATIEFDEVTNVMYQREEIIDAVYEMVIWLHEKGVL